MAKIQLVNLPFCSVQQPSIGLTQIKSRLKSCLGERVSVDVLYLNIDFSHYMGLKFYSSIAESMEHHNTGLGDWFFRQVAFPELPPNTDEYFQRFYPHPIEHSKRLRSRVENKRLGLIEALQKLIDDYHLDQADIVGFSSTFAQNGACMAMARLLKERRPDLVTVMGGANCESAMGQAIALNVRSIDFVFSGPSLISFPRFVGHYIQGEFQNMHAIPGVFSRKNQTQSPFTVVNQTPVAPLGEDLDINTAVTLDYKEYLAKYNDNYRDSPKKPSLLFETSRGCWWGDKAHCTFCGLNGETMKYRSMQPDKAVALIESLFEHANECAGFECVDNILPRHYIKDVYARLSAPPHTGIFCEVKADLSESDLATLARAGVRRIQPGIESLATSTLKLMKKGTTATQNVLFLRNCVMNGVQPCWNLLVGFPGEREEVYSKYCADLPLLTHLFPPSDVFPVRFDRFSPYFDKAGEYGLDLRPLDYYRLTYPFPKQTLFDMAYYFADRNADADYFVAMVEWLGRLKAKLARWRTLWDADKLVRQTQPKLHFVAETAGTILDSRSGDVLRYDVSLASRQLIESLYKPKTISSLSAELPDIALTAELAALESKGLIFREGERVLGLVCPHEPPVTAPLA